MLTKNAAEALHSVPLMPPPRPPSAPSPTSASLISPLGDSLLIGGASLLTFLLFWLFVDKDASTVAISTTAFALTFVINSPHFAASYMLMYGDYRSMIRIRPSYFWAAVVSPVLLIAVLIGAYVARSQMLLGFMIQGMYLSVGWHYVKQTFGTAIVTSAAQRRFFTKWERAAILLNLYSVWAMSWIAANSDGVRNDSSGVMYYTLNLPAWCLPASYWVMGVTFIIAVALMTRKWIETGVWPSTAALVSFASIYVWYLPTLAHPAFYYLVPFFHSLQYMLFVGTMKWNQSRAAAVGSYDARASRALLLKKFAGFFAVAIVLGALAFEFIPHSMDASMPLEDLALGPTMWMFAISWFINVHHYFIDNVIWRNDNELVRQHLVVASMERA